MTITRKIPNRSAMAPAIDQIRRQVHRDERDMEAAGKEPEHQQHV
jgi:hypothetical protein